MNANDAGLRMRVEVFKTLSQPTRLAIFDLLQSGEKSVGQIVEATGRSHNLVSQSLARLRRYDLVRVRKDGRFAIYSLANPKVVQLLKLADELMIDIARDNYRFVSL
jgi:DNA-binding transcriptional ArsR family regulator